MQLFIRHLIVLAVGMAVLGLPTSDYVEEAVQNETSEFTTTGITDQGVPYNTTRGIRKLPASESKFFPCVARIAQKLTIIPHSC